MPYLRAHPKGFVLDVSIIPRASQTKAVGLYDLALRIRLAAPPVDGKANDELLHWLAKTLKLPLTQLQILRGDKGRRKQILLITDKPDIAAQWRVALAAQLTTARVENELNIDVD